MHIHEGDNVVFEKATVYLRCDELRLFACQSKIFDGLHTLTDERHTTQLIGRTVDELQTITRQIVYEFPCADESTNMLKFNHVASEA